MTEEEARTKWCPMARPASVRPEDCGEIRGNRNIDGSVDHSAFCIGSACMAWRLIAEPEVRRRSYEADESPIDEQVLSVRTMIILERMGIKTVGEIRRTPDIVFLRQAGCGRKSLNEMREVYGPYDPYPKTQRVGGYCGLAGRP